MHIEGVFTAFVTPFREGALDSEALTAQLERQIASGIDGLVAAGTTGEGAALTSCEKERVIEIALCVANKTVPVFATVHEASTRKAVEEAKKAARLGADGLLALTPPYVKPTQEGLFAHFRALAEEVCLPLIIYHHPGRTATRLHLETLARLAENAMIVGIKEGSVDLGFAAKLLSDLPDDFSILSGDDLSALPLLALGARGVVSVISNVKPKEMKTLVDASLRSDLKTARAVYRELLPLMEASMMETNPIPIKAMMELAGDSVGPCRLPLTPLCEKSKKKLRELILGTLSCGATDG